MKLFFRIFAIEFCLGFGNWDLELLDRVKPENEKGVCK